ncbi:MAG: MFS transporter [Candidatus Korobacteraceae bacterium]|jgi:AAHS family benzoate transporter-like MFS transporter
MSTTSGAVKGNSTINVNQWFNGAELNGFHWMVFVLSLGIIMFDGYDLFIYAGSIPLVMKEFHISPTMAGAIGSYMLAGAAIGALVLGSLADVVGRKNALMWFAALFSVSMFLTGLTHGATTFAICRFFTGLGVGGSLPNVTALASEYVPGRKRATIIATIYAGINVGGVVAALLSIWLFPHYGWRSVYFMGGIPLLVLPIYGKFLPESPVRLVRRNRLEKLRVFLRKARPQEIVPDNSVLEVEKGSGKAPIAAIFMEGRALSTVLFWIIWFMNVYVIFGFTLWLPKLIMNHGFSLATGLSFLLALSAAAIVGSCIAGVIADRVGTKPTLVGYYLLSFCSVGLVGFTGNYTYLMILVCLAGAGFNGAQNTMNSYMPPYYPPSMRSTATGVCYGLSRLGAILGPLLIGALMTAHFSYRTTLFALAGPSLISTIGIIAIQEKYSFSRKLAAEQKALAQNA